MSENVDQYHLVQINECNDNATSLVTPNVPSTYTYHAPDNGIECPNKDQHPSDFNNSRNQNSQISDLSDTGDMLPFVHKLHDFRVKHRSNFIFCHININSYRHKFASMCDALNRNIVDYLAISETKLDESFPHSQFYVQDYVLHRKDFTASSGGLLAYVRADLPHRRLVNIDGHTDGIECLCIEITIGKTKTVLTCLYKHPKVKHDIFANYFSSICDELLKSYDDLVFLGDLNCCPTKSNTVKNICDTYCLTNLIKDPTCHKGPTPTLLDAILVNNPRKYLDIINVPCEISDVHNIIGAATRRFAPLLKPHTIYYRSYKNFNDQSYVNDISMAPFHVADIFDDVDDVAWFTSALISDVIDSHAPIRSKTLKKHSVPYMNGALRKAIYARSMARNKFKKFGNAYWELNRKHRNNVVALRKRSLSNYFSKKCSQHDKSFWNTISPFISDKKARNGNNIILQDGDKIVADEISVSELFNEYFSNIASEIGFTENITSAEDAIQHYSCHPSITKIKSNMTMAEDFNFSSVTSDSVMLCLKNINPRKSTGFDNIPGKLIRLAHRELAVPITNLINVSMTQSVFPDIYKCAEVSPIFKKTDSLCRGNYRPVSVLTCLSKICETIYNDQLYDHFVNIFDKLLSAFRKGYSCQSLLIKLVDDWKTALDQGMTVGTVFMDKKKHSIVFHMVCLWQKCVPMVSPCPHVNWSLVTLEIGGSESRFLMHAAHGPHLKREYPKVLSWDLFCLTFSLTICFISLRKACCITMPMTTAYQHGEKLLKLSLPT